jgi:signal transduction histidine kinase
MNDASSRSQVFFDDDPLADAARMAARQRDIRFQSGRKWRQISPWRMGDRVQLRQVLMNLMTNSIDAMKAVNGTRELAIKSQRAENEQLLVSVSDTVGLPQQADQIFEAFFTTKPHGTSMGLRICRSIVGSHGGRLWTANNSARGANFCFTQPPKSDLNDASS